LFSRVEPQSRAAMFHLVPKKKSHRVLFFQSNAMSESSLLLVNQLYPSTSLLLLLTPSHPCQKSSHDEQKLVIAAEGFQLSESAFLMK
jgi:hypothetical protein